MPLLSLSRNDLKEILSDQPKYRIDQIWKGIYEQHLRPSEVTTLPKPLREQLGRDPRFNLAGDEVEVLQADGGKTIKTLTRFSDGREVESVLMRYDSRVTLCVSSQAGCAMGCVFCATGQAGFFRHLSSDEILEQVFLAARRAKDLYGARLSNLVFMGMGEPLANYDNVIDAIAKINFEFSIAARHITVSTVGIIPGILKLAENPMQISLAVSLHAANDELRTRLVPINARYPLDDLVASLNTYRERSNRRISFEWAMMADINDHDSDAFELAEIAKSVKAHVNLIPLNPTPLFPTPGTELDRVYEFRDILNDAGVNATVRMTRGNQIAAACGQLSTQVKVRRASRGDEKDL
jgi:23S rRNA (adenine2503-C2)-methyltransferase